MNQIALANTIIGGQDPQDQQDPQDRAQDGSSPATPNPNLDKTVIGQEDPQENSDGFSLNLEGHSLPRGRAPSNLNEIMYQEVAGANFDAKLDRIGNGAQGDVFEATRRGAERAIKRYPISQWESALREWRILATYASQGIVPNPSNIFRDSEYIYIEMERFYGAVWRESPVFSSDRSSNPDGSLLRDPVAILSKVVEAVALLHEEGIIHRDLKPGNIMIGKHNQPILLDFGLAGHIRDGGVTSHSPSPTADSHSTPYQTMTGRVAGTPGYMAPEQARQGLDVIHTRATDVYSLGAILYHILSGKPQVGASGVKEDQLAMLIRIRDGKIEPIETPKRPIYIRDRGDWCGYSELVAICNKAMELDPAKRYPSAHEMLEDLNCWRDGRRVKAYRPQGVVESVSYNLRHFKRENPGKVGVLAGVLTAATFLGGYLYKAETDRSAAVARVDQGVGEIVAKFRSDLAKIFEAQGVAEARVEVFDAARASGEAGRLFGKALDDLARVDVTGIKGRDLKAVTAATSEVLGEQKKFQARCGRRDEALAVLKDMRDKMIPVRFLGGNISDLFPELSRAPVNELLAVFFPAFKPSTDAMTFKDSFFEITPSEQEAIRRRIVESDWSPNETNEVEEILAKVLLAKVIGLPRDSNGEFAAGVDQEILTRCKEYVELAEKFDGSSVYTMKLLMYRLAKALALVEEDMEEVELYKDLAAKYEAELIEMEGHVLAGIVGVSGGYLTGDFTVPDQIFMAEALGSTGINIEGSVEILLRLYNDKSINDPSVNASVMYHLAWALGRKARGVSELTMGEESQLFMDSADLFSRARKILEEQAKNGGPEILGHLELSLQCFEAEAWELCSGLAKASAQSENKSERDVIGSDAVNDRGAWEEIFYRRAEGLYDDALARAEESDRKTAIMFYFSGIFDYESGKLESAKRKFEEALRIADKAQFVREEWLAMSAIVQARTGQTSKALAQVRQILSGNPGGTDTISRALIALLLSAQGDRQKLNEVYFADYAAAAKECLNRLLKYDDGATVLVDELSLEGLQPRDLSILCDPALLRALEAATQEVSTTLVQ